MRNLIATLLLALIGCVSDRQTTAPRPVSVSPGQPVVATCPVDDCICLDPPTAYERVGSCCANFPAGYPGNGTRTVTVLTDTTGLVFAWPGTLCGEHMALNADCRCTRDRYVETEMQARTFAVWPIETRGGVGQYEYGDTVWTIVGPAARFATFRLRPGLDYWIRQGAATVYLAADADSVEVTQPPGAPAPGGR